MPGGSSWAVTVNNAYDNDDDDNNDDHNDDDEKRNVKI